VLREVEGLEYDAIAAVLEMRPGAVRVLVHRARETLRCTLLRRWPDTFG
jgi:DNA-directed RNA polymerase specialized sigma24 family protein